MVEFKRKIFTHCLRGNGNNSHEEQVQEIVPDNFRADCLHNGEEEMMVNP